MRKILVIIMAVLLLAGCTQDNTIVTENRAVNSFPEEILDFACELTEGHGERYIGTGVAVSVYADMCIPDTGPVLYPVFENDILVLVLMHEHGDISVLDCDLAAMESYLGSEVSYVEVEGNIYLVTDNDIYFISGNLGYELKEVEERVMKKLQKIQGINPMGRRRIRLYDNISDGNTVTDPETGISYSNSRLVVRFREGDTDKMVQEFAEYCQGTLRTSVGGMHVFEVKPSSYTVLMSFIDRAMETFDYIEDIILDRVIDPLDDPVINTPVTE